MNDSTYPDRLFVCGFMGAGKSTLGKALAGRLDVPYRDLDAFIEDQQRKTIPEIFEEQGEPGFRAAEKAALLETIRTFEGVVSLGGGSLQNQHMTDYIKNNGLLIFIDTPFSVIFQRITKDKSRPLLLDEKGEIKPQEQLEQELKLLYNQRKKLYGQAVISLNPVNYNTAEEAVEQLIKKIRYHD